MILVWRKTRYSTCIWLSYGWWGGADWRCWIEKENVPYCGWASNKRRTKSQTLNVSRLALQLPLPNPLKPGIQSRMEMKLCRRWSNYIWAINNFIACQGATYIRCLTVYIHRRHIRWNYYGSYNTKNNTLYFNNKTCDRDGYIKSILKLQYYKKNKIVKDMNNIDTGLDHMIR